MANFRQCKDCEFFVKRPVVTWGECHLNPPTFTGQGASFPHVEGDSFCGQWAPKMDDNPAIAAAWEDFKIIWKLAKENHNG